MVKSGHISDRRGKKRWPKRIEGYKDRKCPRGCRTFRGVLSNASHPRQFLARRLAQRIANVDARALHRSLAYCLFVRTEYESDLRRARAKPVLYYAATPFCLRAGWVCCTHFCQFPFVILTWQQQHSCHLTCADCAIISPRARTACVLITRHAFVSTRVKTGGPEMTIREIIKGV